MSNFLSSPNFRRATASVVTAATIYSGALACSSPEQKSSPKPTQTCNPDTSPSCVLGPNSTVQHKQETTPTTLSAEAQKLAQEAAEHKAAMDYAISAERNSMIDANVQEVGAKIVKAADTNAMGPFDFYNMESKRFGRKGNPGWGSLQHNPQYGGSSDTTSVTVYMDEQGHVDLSRGIKGLDVKDANGSVHYVAPGGEISSDGHVVHANSWEVRVVTYEDYAQGNVLGTTSSEYEAGSATVKDLQINDLTADGLSRNFVEMHKL